MALSVDLSWNEKKVSFALNRKHLGVLKAGRYEGFRVDIGTGLNVFVRTENGGSVALVSTDEGQFTVRETNDVPLTIPVNATSYVVIEVNYNLGQETEVSLKVTKVLNDNMLVLATFVVPNQVTSLTTEMLTRAPRADYGLGSMVVEDIHADEALGSGFYRAGSGKGTPDSSNHYLFHLSRLKGRQGAQIHIKDQSSANSSEVHVRHRDANGDWSEHARLWSDKNLTQPVQAHEWANITSAWEFQDGVSLRWGNESDFRVWWDSAAGAANLRTITNGADIYLSATNLAGQTKHGIRIVSDNVVYPIGYYNGSARFRAGLNGFDISPNGTDFHKAWHAGNDGSGSGLDADKLDGLQSGQFLRSDMSESTIDGGKDTTLNIRSWDTGMATLNVIGNAQGSGRVYVGQSLNYGGGFYYNGDDAPDMEGRTDYVSFFRRSDGVESIVFDFAQSSGGVDFKDSPTVGGAKIWHSGNDGAGSLLDADKLDGVHASQFMRSDASDAKTSGYTRYTDGANLEFGTSGDFKIYFDRGSNVARLRGLTHGSDILLETENNVGLHHHALRVMADDDVFTVLYHNSSARTRTTSTGLQISSDGTDFHKAWHAGNDGSGSGLDADKVDGLQGYQLARNDAANVFHYVNTFNRDIGLKSGAKLYFEDGQHCITNNDGMGNFNIRVGHDFSEKLTASSGAIHLEFSHETPSPSFKIHVSGNRQSSAVGDSADMTQVGEFFYDRLHMYMPIRLQNNVGVQSIGSGGAPFEILRLSSGNYVDVGSSSLPMILRSSETPKLSDGSRLYHQGNKPTDLIYDDVIEMDGHDTGRLILKGNSGGSDAYGPSVFGIKTFSPSLSLFDLSSDQQSREMQIKRKSGIFEVVMVNSSDSASDASKYLEMDGGNVWRMGGKDVIRRGDYGLGAVATYPSNVSVTSANDWDEITGVSGFFMASNAANDYAPDGGPANGWQYGINVAHGNNGWDWTIGSGFNAGNTLTHRKRVNGVWQPYIKIYDELHPPTALEVSAIPAAGGDFTGALNFKGSDAGDVLRINNKPLIQRLTSNGGLMIGCDDTVILGSGEAHTTTRSNITSRTSEQLFLSSDNDIILYTNLQTGWSARESFKMSGAGVLEVPNSILVGGDQVYHEGNQPKHTDIAPIRSVQGGGDAAYVGTPEGAMYSIDSSNQVGAFKIRLPVSWTSHMMTMVVEVFDYTSGSNDNGCARLYIGGYNYAATESWSSISVDQVGGNQKISVRLDHDGTNCCIYIGDVNSNWQYPKVIVRDFTYNYGPYHENFRFGWVISKVNNVGSKPSFTNRTYSDNYAPIASNVALTDKDHVIFDAGLSTTVDVMCDDGGMATLNVLGSNQGTGLIYVGQSSQHGGGFYYNGDDTPDMEGGADRVTFFRRDSGVDTGVFSYRYGSGVVEFVEAPTVGNNKVVTVAGASFAGNIKLPNGANTGLYSSDTKRLISNEVASRTLRIGTDNYHAYVRMHGVSEDSFEVYYENTHKKIWHEGNFTPNIEGITGLQSALNGKASSGHTHSVSDLPSASVNGRGITQLSDSISGNSTVKAATENAVRKVAEMVGPKITVSSSAPISPAAGDIWIDIG